MRRSTAEIRRAIKLEDADAEEYRGLLETPLGHRSVADVLRWCAGDPGTHYERIVRQRNKADVAKMPGGGHERG